MPGDAVVPRSEERRRGDAVVVQHHPFGALPEPGDHVRAGGDLVDENVARRCVQVVLEVGTGLARRLRIGVLGVDRRRDAGGHEQGVQGPGVLPHRVAAVEHGNEEVDPGHRSPTVPTGPRWRARSRPPPGARRAPGILGAPGRAPRCPDGGVGRAGGPAPVAPDAASHAAWSTVSTTSVPPGASALRAASIRSTFPARVTRSTEPERTTPDRLPADRPCRCSTTSASAICICPGRPGGIFPRAHTTAPRGSTASTWRAAGHDGVDDRTAARLPDHDRERSGNPQPDGDLAHPLAEIRYREVEFRRSDPEWVGDRLEPLDPGGQEPECVGHRRLLGRRPSDVVHDPLRVLGQILRHRLDDVAEDPLPRLRPAAPVPQIRRQSGPGLDPGGAARRGSRAGASRRRTPSGPCPRVPVGRSRRGARAHRQPGPTDRRRAPTGPRPPDPPVPRAPPTRRRLRPWSRPVQASPPPSRT